MSVSSVIHDIEAGATITESITPLVVQLVLDALAVPANPLAIAKLFTDLADDLPRIAAAIKANNVEVIPVLAS